MSLTSKVLLAMGLGSVVGLIINMGEFNGEDTFIQLYVIEGLFYLIGTLFITALKMLVVPLVFFSLISGVFGIGDISKLGKVGAKSFLLYMVTTALAIGLAMLLAVSIIPLFSTPSFEVSAFEAKEAPPLLDVLINIVPANVVDAFAQGKMLQIIFFTILLGISLLMVGSKAKGIAEGVEVMNEAMMNMVTIVMSVAPYAVFALLAKAVSELGFELLQQLIIYVVVIVLALMLHLFGTLMILFKLLTTLNPFIFLRKIRDAQLFAFSTASSNATIPITLRSLTKRMGVDNSVASFTVPFGATINMDGTAIMQGVATVFIAHIYGIELGLGGYITVIAMSLLASIGTAGVPGVGLIMLSMVFVQVGIPVEGIALILGVDRLLDMVRTAVNVTGDAVVTSIVAKSEDAMVVEQFHREGEGELEELHLDASVEREFAKAIDDIEKS
jgi:Na+/H+-dicarboxylate symporter